MGAFSLLGDHLRRMPCDFGAIGLAGRKRQQIF